VSSKDKPTISLIANRLLTLLKATRPLAGKDKERPHLMMVRFVANSLTLEASATDGHTMGLLTAGVQACSEPVTFCIETAYLPMIEKLLSRLDQKERSEATVEIVVGKAKVQFKIQQSEVFAPKAPEQLEFPDTSRAVPERFVAGRYTAGTWGMNPELLARVLRCAGQAGIAVEFTAPETSLSPMRLDITENTAGYEGTFVVMPMRLDEPMSSAGGDERQTDLDEAAE